MSASVVHPQTPSREWLPMPIDDTDDSFARDLIRQFDKKQSRLRHEMAELENQNSVCSQPHTTAEEEKDKDDNALQQSRTRTHSSKDDQQHQQQQPTTHADVQQHPKENIVLTDKQQQRNREPSPPDSLEIEDHPEPLQPEPPPTPPSPATTINKMRQRTAAAGDLLRRSSAYLRSKFLKSVTRAEESNNHQQQQQQQRFDGAMPPPAKIAINTTISIPHHPPAHHANIQPPIITHYPPRPLRYSPVEPLENEPRKSTLHRISLPVLTRATLHPEKRRLSDTTKAKLWFLCRPSKKSKGKERAATATATAAPGLS